MIYAALLWPFRPHTCSYVIPIVAAIASCMRRLLALPVTTTLTVTRATLSRLAMSVSVMSRSKSRARIWLGLNNGDLHGH